MAKYFYRYAVPSELENRQSSERVGAPSTFERQYLKRPPEFEDSLPHIHSKKLKLEQSIPLIEDNDLFIFIYMKMTFNVINNLIKSGKNWATISDLCKYLLIDTHQLTEEKLDNFLSEIAEIRSDNTVRKLDKENIIRQLQNIEYIDKYLNVVLYELNFNLCLMSLIHSSYLSLYMSLFDEFYVDAPSKKLESSYVLKFLHHKQNINIDLSLFSITYVKRLN